MFWLLDWEESDGGSTDSLNAGESEPPQSAFRLPELLVLKQSHTFRYFVEALFIIGTEETFFILSRLTVQVSEKSWQTGVDGPWNRLA